MPTIGVCRSLHVYTDYDDWSRFLRALGCRIHLSAPTSRSDLEAGIRVAPAEVCLPVKAFLGQLATLVTEVDFVLIPRVVCRMVAGRPFFGCPKSQALPDLVRALFPRFDKWLELLIDERAYTTQESFVMMARSLSCSRAEALHAWLSCQGLAAVPGSCTEQLWHLWGMAKKTGFCRGTGHLRFVPDGVKSQGPVVGVVAHPYLLFDRLLSLDLLQLLKGLGATVFLPEYDRQPRSDSVISRELKVVAAMTVVDTYPNWLYELSLLTAACRFIRDPVVDGLLLVSSFACGTAAVMNEIIRRNAARVRSIPILIVLLDEHTNAAGLATRLESFVDILRRRDGRVFRVGYL
ncbi:MAG: acyl-CoA dehydratase activase-related protein, partial [candidate division WOR-3 bacterium]